MLDKAKFATKKNSNIYQKDLSIDELKKLSTFLSKIFKKNLSFQLKNKFSAEFLNWLYNENPNGKAIVNNVYEDEKIIASRKAENTINFDQLRNSCDIGLSTVLMKKNFFNEKKIN